MKKEIGMSIRKWAVSSGLLLLAMVTLAGAVQAVELTAAEKDQLMYMREEEKLARDVYTYLYGKWGGQIFYRISLSEQQHMSAVKTLLDRYGVADPAAGKPEGAFTNPELQTLYHQLIAQGSVSYVDALKVGVTIEETDINDLNAGIATTSRRDIAMVYKNLLRGSQNHLKAFISNLAAQGFVYEP